MVEVYYTSGARCISHKKPVEGGRGALMKDLK